MARFIGIVHHDARSDYGVCFPDFPGCITAGRTLDEAMDMAEEALRGHIAVMHEHGEMLPTKPRTLSQAKAHALAKDAAMFVAVEAPLPSKPVRVNVMLDSAILAQISRVSTNRSAFLNQAAREKLGI
jgi:predicted RNase H-like HicB family nuclease